MQQGEGETGSHDNHWGRWACRQCRTAACFAYIRMYVCACTRTVSRKRVQWYVYTCTYVSSVFICMHVMYCMYTIYYYVYVYNIWTYICWKCCTKAYISFLAQALLACRPPLTHTQKQPLPDAEAPESESESETEHKDEDLIPM